MDSLCLEGEVVALCLHVGGTLNGHKITKIARDPLRSFPISVGQTTMKSESSAIEV